MCVPGTVTRGPMVTGSPRLMRRRRLHMLQGENAWVFVNEECIGETVKSYYKFEEDLFNEAKKVAPKGVEVKKPTEVASVVMSGKVLSNAEVSARAAAEPREGLQPAPFCCTAASSAARKEAATSRGANMSMHCGWVWLRQWSRCGRRRGGMAKDSARK